LSPQHFAAPSLAAQAIPRDKVTAETPEDMPKTLTGLVDDSLSPLPKSPSLFDPQHFRAPFAIAQVTFSPAAIAVTPDVNPVTCTGELEFVLLPLPN
jgi:hypothetical protein